MLHLYIGTLERAGLSQQKMTFYLEAMVSGATRLQPLLRGDGTEMVRLGDQAHLDEGTTTLCGCWRPWASFRLIFAPLKDLISWP